MSFRGVAYQSNKQRLKAYVDFAQSDTRHMMDFNDMNHLIDSVLSKGDTIQVMDALDKITQHCPYYTEGFVLKFRIHMAREQ